MKKFVLISVVAVILLSCGIFAQEKFPAYTGYVNDLAGVIDKDNAAKILHNCNEIKRRGFGELAIVTVKSTAPLDPKTYAVKLFETWKIGEKGKDNGVLVLLSMEDRRAEIEVGYGLEGVITDAMAGQILDIYAVQEFKDGRYGEGLFSLTTAIYTLMSRAAGKEMEEVKELGERPSTAVPESNNIVTAVIIAAFVLMMLLSVFAAGIASGIFGAIFGAVLGFSFFGVIGAVIGAIIGFVLSYTRFPTSRNRGGWGGGFGGGFGGGGGGFSFGGGGSGGGGAGRSW